MVPFILDFGCLVKGTGKDRKGKEIGITLRAITCRMQRNSNVYDDAS